MQFVQLLLQKHCFIHPNLTINKMQKKAPKCIKQAPKVEISLFCWILIIFKSTQNGTIWFCLNFKHFMFNFEALQHFIVATLICINFVVFSFIPISICLKFNYIHSELESAKLLLFCNFCNTLSLSPVTKKIFKKIGLVKRYQK